MIRLTISLPGEEERVVEGSSPLTIGRGPGVDVVIPHWRIARRHAVIRERHGTLWICDQDTWRGTSVAGRRILAETPVDEHDIVTLGSARLFATWVVSSPPHDSPSLVRGTRSTLPDTIPGRPNNADIPDHGARQARITSDHRRAVVHSDHDENPLPCESAYTYLANALTDPADRVANHAPTVETGSSPTGEAHQAPAAEDRLHQISDLDIGLRKTLHRQLLDALDLRREDVAAMSDVHLRVRAADILRELLSRDTTGCPADRREAVVRAVLDEAVGLGPLEPLLADESVTEIMVNRYDEIYVERQGRLTRCVTSFSDSASVLAVIERIVTPIGRRIDESSPMVDARLPDGSRVNAIIAPLALKGPALTIRKFPRKRLTLAELVDRRTLHPCMASFLSLCVARRRNIIVSGGTGSGKTTLLNILSSLIAPQERVVTIEDAAELQLPHEHVVSLEARPANAEGSGQVTIRDLVRNALRMRPDRIVVGECRGAEAFDMLAAMNTGHEGSLTTLHANTPRDALARLETMILMAGMALPLQAVREHISAGIDLVVQQSRLPNGRRVVSEIAEITGMESGAILVQPLYRRHRSRDTWEGCGVPPSFIDAWRAEGVAIDPAWFDPDLRSPTAAPAMTGDLP